MNYRTTALTSIVITAAVLLLLYGWLSQKWAGEAMKAVPQELYSAAQPDGDTLRIVLLGDSWTGMHRSGGHDSALAARLQRFTGRPVSVVSVGKGGANSRHIHTMMYSRLAKADPFLGGLSAEDVLRRGAHYAVVTAGINDARGNGSASVFASNVTLIVRQLLACGIRPVVLEMPEVGLSRLAAYKSRRDRLADRLRSVIFCTKPYSLASYREALRSRLQSEGLADSVVCIPADSWLPQGWLDPRGLFLDDGIHLNTRGYQLLDSTLVEFIVHSS